MDTNLQVLRRRDPEIQEILYRAKHVTMYELITTDAGNFAWQRSEIEGPLFVVRRQSSPQHQFIVLNRLSDALFAEDLHEGEPFQIEHHENFVMYQKGNDIDRGVWFYDQRECQGFVELVTKSLMDREEPQFPVSGAAPLPLFPQFVGNPIPPMYGVGVMSPTKPNIHHGVGMPFPGAPPTQTPPVYTPPTSGNLLDTLFGTAPSPVKGQDPTSRYAMPDQGKLTQPYQNTVPQPTSTSHPPGVYRGTTVDVASLFETPTPSAPPVAPAKEKKTVETTIPLEALLGALPTSSTQPPSQPKTKPTEPPLTDLLYSPAKAPTPSTPQQPQQTTPTTPSTVHQRDTAPTELTRAQFKAALLKLVNSDAFIDAVYAHYINKQQRHSAAIATSKDTD